MITQLYRFGITCIVAVPDFHRSIDDLGISTKKALPIAVAIWVVYFYLFAKVGDNFPTQAHRSTGTARVYADLNGNEAT